MKLKVNNVYRHFNRKFKRLNRSKHYSAGLVLKTLTVLMFLYFILDVIFWDVWTMQLLKEYRHKIDLLELYLEVQSNGN